MQEHLQEQNNQAYELAVRQSPTVSSRHALHKCKPIVMTIIFWFIKYSS